MAKKSDDVKIIHTNAQIVKNLSIKCGISKVRLNIVTDKIEIIFLDDKTEEMSDAILGRLVNMGQRLEQDYGRQYAVERNIVHALNEVAKANEYHPIKEYLLACRKKYLENLKPQLGDFLSAFLVEEEHAEAFDVCFTRWLCGCVARVFFEHQNTMLILQGAQGKGKSSVFLNLCKGIKSYYIDEQINLYDKDDSIKLATKFIWVVEEFGSVLMGQNRNLIKAFITKNTSDVRSAYARYSKRRERICSFAATVNDEEILTDPTGNRRYMVLPLLKCETPINFEILNAIDYDALWGELTDMVMGKGEDAYKLSLRDKQLQEMLNKKAEVVDPIHELINCCIEKGVGQVKVMDVVKLVMSKGLHAGVSSKGLSKVIRDTLSYKYGALVKKSNGVACANGVVWKKGMHPEYTFFGHRFEEKETDQIADSDTEF